MPDTTTLKIPAIPDPKAALAAILEHVAAIDALVNGIVWASPDAEHRAQDAGVFMTDAMDALHAAVSLDAEGVA